MMVVVVLLVSEMTGVSLFLCVKGSRMGVVFSTLRAYISSRCHAYQSQTKKKTIANNDDDADARQS